MDWGQYLRIIDKIGSRYFLAAAIAFILFYVVLRRRVFYQKIQQRFPKNADYLREAGYSLLTIFIFGTIVVFLYHPAIAPYTTVYKNISDHSLWYYFAVFPIMFIMHDTYFYFTHRIMHHKALFKWFHLVHHQSTNPSPWAAYAFHPLEAVVEQGILVVFYFTIPIHITHAATFFLMSIIYNVYGHLGYELYPRGFSKTMIGKWINTSVSHNQHHQYFKGNYGLYLLFWDRMMGTLRADYDQRFEEVKTRVPGTEEGPSGTQAA
jgi:lathosterol oxidase